MSYMDDANANLNVVSDLIKVLEHVPLEETISIVQAQATLAVAQQQRIANLIALSQATNADGSRIAPWAITHPVDDWSVAVNDEILKGLGL